MNSKPLILAVETSGRAGSVAVARGQDLLAETAFTGPMRHSAELFPAVQNLLKNVGQKPKDIDHIYISVGPGSFTGLRIAVTFAKTMHLANNAKIVAVDTLDVIAANVISPPSSHEPRAPSPELIAAILDAKRGQFFIAAYKRNTSHGSRVTSHGHWDKIVPDGLMTASEFLEKFARKQKPIWLLGEGLVYYKDKFKADNIHFLDESLWPPKAANVHFLGYQKAQAGQFADALTLQPNYLRVPDLKVKQR